MWNRFDKSAASHSTLPATAVRDIVSFREGGGVQLDSTGARSLAGVYRMLLLLLHSKTAENLLRL